MTFNSWEFLIFYPIVASLYFLLPKKMKWPMLLIASYYFYAFYQAQLLFLIVLTTAVSFFMSHLIERTEKQLHKKLYLALTLTVCLGVLFFYKYFNFLSSGVSGIIALFGKEPPRIILDLVLPVGISFYTFQTLSYVIDVYRGEVKTEKNFFFYALFVSFFPQLVAGPIERPGNLIPQLKEPHEPSRENFIRGSKQMLLGFFKKICVADLVSAYVSAVYNSAENATSIAVIFATLMFAVQIYCDFSGYTDIATGCARIMGIKLMKNFDHPYSASSIKEFWSRWHISLSGWFKDYLYIPLGGSRRSPVRNMLNVFIVFLVSGLWHGANWTFVVWGALHGIYRVVGTLTVKKRNDLICRIGLSPDSRPIVIMRRVCTFLLVCFAWIFFRANTISDAFALIGALFTHHAPIASALSSMSLDGVSVFLIILSIATMLLLDRLVSYSEDDGSDILVKNGAFIYYVFAVVLVWLLLLSKGQSSTFIYFQF
jgi:D-alanyl-lipoteichoic acid acyltransferase DltB (MBOAT superfamily)